MNVFVMPVGALATNCYLVWDDKKNAVVIDPGDEAERILAEAAARDLTIHTILLTHLHYDHYLGVPGIVAATGARLIIPKEEGPAVTDDSRTFIDSIPAERQFRLQPDGLVDEGETVTVGDLTFTVWRTPGHSAGSSCYLCEDALFSGDTLFAGTIGRSDPPSGSDEDMHNSLMRLAAYPENLRVFPGHGEATTLDIERRFNPFMK